MNNINKRVFWITRTAVLIALLIVLQAVTMLFGSTIVTGAIVNLILIISVMTCGLPTGLTVAIISPVMAKALGIGPLWSLIPFIAVGNLVLILIWHFVGNIKMSQKYVPSILALIIAAISKFLILYIGIVQIAIPLLLNLPEKQATVISGMFSFQQLLTALTGGIIATIILPTLKKAIKFPTRNS